MQNHQDKITNNIDTPIEFDSMDTFGGSVYGIKEVAMGQYNRCCIEGSKEMVTGGVKKLIINGLVVEKIVQNQIEIFINSVEMLKIILQSSIEKHKKFIQSKLDHYEDLKKQLEKMYKEKIDETESWLQPNNEKWMDKHLKEYNNRLSKINKAYEDRRVLVFKQLLIVLGFLLNRENYFEEIKTRM